MDFVRYIRSWLQLALRHSLGKADNITIGVFIVLGFLSWASRFLPDGTEYPDWLDATMQIDEWHILTWVLGAIVLTRLLLAPYWLYKQKVGETNALREQKDALEKKLEEGRRGEYSLVWYDEEWLLREAHGERNYWDDEATGTGLQLVGWIAINLKDRIRVESIEIDIGGCLFASDWQSQSFYTSEGREVRFNVPLDIPRGKRTAILKAIVDGEQYSPKPIHLDIPKGKRVLHTGGSQPE